MNNNSIGVDNSWYDNGVCYNNRESDPVLNGVCLQLYDVRVVGSNNIELIAAELNYRASPGDVVLHIRIQPRSMVASRLHSHYLSVLV